MSCNVLASIQSLLGGKFHQAHTGNGGSRDVLNADWYVKTDNSSHLQQIFTLSMWHTAQRQLPLSLQHEPLNRRVWKPKSPKASLALMVSIWYIHVVGPHCDEQRTDELKGCIICELELLDMCEWDPMQTK